ncbi:hypothetical protein B0T11DRAFT_5876 [Plectosphaerella cucumerina]|uniref:Uncharacterized protein n=1 Tax=Plectosphaerella cucumerina TaxID=40658 RepID=A0A8K0TPN7_9PEZI|nr:hypothetical protein B0T11DRAFT_5876 [Plectosphaerella cucumerina]
MQAPCLTLVALVASVTASPTAIKERPTSCRIFQLFASPLATSGGTPRFLQPGTCCCANNFCVITNGGVTAQATLNANMGATFDLNANGATGRESIDFNGFAWTVAGRGVC